MIGSPGAFRRVSAKLSPNPALGTGRRARAAVGMSSLAADASVEIEMVVEIGDAK